MEGLQPGMKLKVKSDTFVLPGLDGRVYFRNNIGSFQMEGASIQGWIEKLLPVFDGKTTLASLTEGLPTPYQNRIYELAGILYDNGVLKDVSQDEGHGMSEEVVDYFVPQIEFVDNLIGSGAARFETYRNAKVLIVGAGTMMMALAGTLFESGLETVHRVTVDSSNPEDATHASNSARLQEVSELYQSLNSQPVIHDLSIQIKSTADLETVIQKMDAVLYVSEDGDAKELCRLESVCRRANKLFLPAVCLRKVGMVGPITWSNSVQSENPGSPGACTWESALCRLHSSFLEADLQVSGFSETAGALLVNVLAFELFNILTGINDGSSENRFYTLNLETLEGSWHAFMPALQGELENVLRLEHPDERLAVNSPQRTLHETLSYFAQITDPVSGIFHVWDEGDLPQLPLALCRVQPVDSVSKGPAKLMEQIVRAGLTHEDARREAGLAGIEAYVQQLIGDAGMADLEGIGAGVTVPEAVGRGLLHSLVTKLKKTLQHKPVTINLVKIGVVDDEECQFCLAALRKTVSEPVIGIGDLQGFPIAWVGVDDGCFIGTVGLSLNMALQQSLEFALLYESSQVTSKRCLNQAFQNEVLTIEPTQYVISQRETVSLDINTWNGFTNKLVESTLGLLAKDGKDVTLVNLAIEPFLMEVLAGVFGIFIREKDTE